MFDNKVKRLGYCCKYIHEDSDDPLTVKNIEHLFNTKSTSVSWLSRQTVSEAYTKLFCLLDHNVAALMNQLKYVSSLPTNRRMLRISSDILPMYTQATWGVFWKQPEIQAYCERSFAHIGNYAREHDIRLSFHPGQFVCLVSDRPDVVDRSIEELEYHAQLASWMGYAKTFQDFKINVHLSGRLGVSAFAAAYTRMSPELRNCLTIENDEYQAGLDTVLQVSKQVAIVMDVHHHWINTGEYISAQDDRVKRVLDSWRSVRPAMHYSYSRCEHLPSRVDVHDSLNDLSGLLREGARKQKLRQHSDFYPNPAANQWALSFWDTFDIQCEAKMKNLSSGQLYQEAVKLGLV